MTNLYPFLFQNLESLFVKPNAIVNAFKSVIYLTLIYKIDIDLIIFYVVFNFLLIDLAKERTNSMKNILLFSILLTNSLFAQMKPAKRYSIYVNHPNYSVKTNVLNSNKNIKPKANLIYYWYSANKIMETQGGFDGKVLDGTYTVFYLSNNLKERGRFKNGLKHGEWTTWFEDGRIHEVLVWKRGVLHGECKTYNEKGELIKIWNVRNNKLHGYEAIYENGKIISDHQYKNGKVLPEKSKENKKSAEKPVKQTETKPGTEKKKEDTKKTKSKKTKKEKSATTEKPKSDVK